MSNRTFVRLMLSVPVTFGLLVGGCIHAAHAAEQTCTRTVCTQVAK